MSADVDSVHIRWHDRSVRKVVVYELMSLDGVAERPDDFFTDWDEAMDANLAAVIGTQDAVVLGRRSYDEWVAYWPGRDSPPFAPFIAAVEKHVVTSTPLAGAWADAHVIGGGLVDAVRKLKERPGGDIGVHASITVAREQLRNSDSKMLMDRMRAVLSYQMSIFAEESDATQRSADRLARLHSILVVAALGVAILFSIAQFLLFRSEVNGRGAIEQVLRRRNEDRRQVAEMSSSLQLADSRLEAYGIIAAFSSRIMTEARAPSMSTPPRATS